MPNHSSSPRWAAILAAIVIGSLCAGLSGGPYQSQDYGYGLEMPEDWQQIPQDVVIRMRDAAMGGKSPATPIIFDAAFQPAKAERWFQYPYVLVQVMPYSQMGLRGQITQQDMGQIVKAVTGLDLGKALDETIASEHLGLISGVEFDLPQLDRPRRRFLWTLNVDVATIGTVRGLCVGHFGNQAVVQVIYYAKADEWDLHGPVREQIMASFQFDPEKAYREEASDPKASTQWPPIFQGAMVGAVVAGAVGVGWVLLTMVRNARAKKPGKE